MICFDVYMSNTNFDTNEYAIFLPQVMLLLDVGHIGGVTELPSDFKWTRLMKQNYTLVK